MGDALEWTHAGRRRRHPFLRDERRRAHPNDEESVSGTRAPLWCLSSLRVLVLLRLRPSFALMHILSWSTRPGLGHVGLRQLERSPARVPAGETGMGPRAKVRDAVVGHSRRLARPFAFCRRAFCALPAGPDCEGMVRCGRNRGAHDARFELHLKIYSHSKEHQPRRAPLVPTFPYAPSTFLQAHPPLNHPDVVFASRTGSADGVHRRAAASSWARTALATGSGTDRAQGSRSTPRWALAMAAARRPSARHAALQQRKKAVFRPGRTGAVIRSRTAPFATADRHPRHTERLEAANSMQNVLGRALNVIRLHYL